MENIEKNTNKTEAEAIVDAAATKPGEEQSQTDIIDALDEAIIRNDTIPETSKNTPGSNGAFPVGAFDTSKD